MTRLLVFCVFLWMGIVLMIGVWSKSSIFRMENLDLYWINTKRGYIENSWLGKIIQNKATFYSSNYFNNFFTGLDPNYYFFGGHPRETADSDRSVKFPFYFLPLILLGLMGAIQNRIGWEIFYFFGTLSVVSFFDINRLWWLLLPAFVGLTLRGAQKLMSMVKK